MGQLSNQLSFTHPLFAHVPFIDYLNYLQMPHVSNDLKALHHLGVVANLM